MGRGRSGRHLKMAVQGCHGVQGQVYFQFGRCLFALVDGDASIIALAATPHDRHASACRRHTPSEVLLFPQGTCVGHLYPWLLLLKPSLRALSCSIALSWLSRFAGKMRSAAQRETEWGACAEAAHLGQRFTPDLIVQ